MVKFEGFKGGVNRYEPETIRQQGTAFADFKARPPTTITPRTCYFGPKR